MFAKTVGLDDSFDFFSWEESRPWRGLRCRAGGAAGLLCRASGAQFCCNIAATRVNHGAILNQIVGEFNAGNPCIPGIFLFRGGFPNGLYST